MTETNGDIVAAFLREALTELWAGRIEVTYSTPWEDPCEPGGHIFFHRGIMFDVVEPANTGSRWLRVAGEHITIPGMTELFVEACSACAAVPVEKQRKEVVMAIRTASEEFIGEHPTGRLAFKIQQVVGGA